MPAPLVGIAIGAAGRAAAGTAARGVAGNGLRVVGGRGILTGRSAAKASRARRITRGLDRAEDIAEIGSAVQEDSSQESASPADGAVRYRIGNVAAGFILAFTILADLLQFLLTLTVLLLPLAYLVTFLVDITLFIWFIILGVNYIGGKRAGAKMAAALTALVSELVPVISALPAFTVAAIVIIWSSRSEDKEKQQKGNT